MLTCYTITKDGDAKITAFLHEHFRDYAALVKMREEEGCGELIAHYWKEEADWAFIHGATTHTVTISADQSVSGEIASLVLTPADFDAETMPDFD